MTNPYMACRSTFATIASIMEQESIKKGAGRILVVDDDRELCELLATYLQRESFTVECVYDGDAALDRAASREFDLLILDVMLPTLPGFEVLRRLRRTSSIPVLMLTARGDDVDRIVGLELGADDYLPKPFNPRELVARIHAILRRAQRPGPGDEALTPPLALGDLTIDPARREVTFAGGSIVVTSVEFDVLAVLTRSAGRIVSRDEISRQALGRPHSAFDRSVDMHVSNLRRKLQAAAGDRILIKAVRSAGYMLATPATTGGGERD